MRHIAPDAKQMRAIAVAVSAMGFAALASAQSATAFVRINVTIATRCSVSHTTGQDAASLPTSHDATTGHPPRSHAGTVTLHRSCMGGAHRPALKYPSNNGTGADLGPADGTREFTSFTLRGLSNPAASVPGIAGAVSGFEPAENVQPVPVRIPASANHGTRADNKAGVVTAVVEF